MIRSNKGIFKPQHPEKYVGKNLNKIEYKSGLELRFLQFLDVESNVLKYAYESVIIPYADPVSQKIRRYYVDFWLRKKNPDNSIENILVEIKPSIQTKPPVVNIKNKNTRRMIDESFTWMTNQAKWEAATKYCKERNWSFIILTEQQLTGMKWQ